MVNLKCQLLLFLLYKKQKQCIIENLALIKFFFIALIMNFREKIVILETIRKKMQSTKHGDDREKLASKLLNCVKQCQIRYGGKTELASEKDIQVAELCSSLEAVLSHGLRSTPITTQLTTSTLKQVSKLIAGRLHLTDDTPGLINFSLFKNLVFTESFKIHYL